MKIYVSVFFSQKTCRKEKIVVNLQRKCELYNYKIIYR